MKQKTRTNQPVYPEVEFPVTIEVSNIKQLTDAQINSLQAGDIVAKKTGNQYHSYVVSYKENGQGICLTYTDASCVETVSYDLVGEHWVYNSTDITPIQKQLYYHGVSLLRRNASQSESDDNVRFALSFGVIFQSKTAFTLDTLKAWIKDIVDNVSNHSMRLVTTGGFKKDSNTTIIASFIFVDKQQTPYRTGILGLTPVGGNAEKTGTEILGIFDYPELELYDDVNEL